MAFVSWSNHESQAVPSCQLRLLHKYIIKQIKVVQRGVFVIKVVKLVNEFSVLQFVASVKFFESVVVFCCGKL